MLVGRAQYGVLNVGRGDLGAVVELDALTQFVGPGLGVAARLARAFGEIRHQLVALLARGRFEHHERAAVQPREIPRVGVVGLASVKGVPVTFVCKLQSAALLVRGIDNAGGSSVKAARAGLGGRPLLATGPAPAAGSQQQCS